jgi:hypothetical protein
MKIQKKNIFLFFFGWSLAFQVGFAQVDSTKSTSVKDSFPDKFQRIGDLKNIPAEKSIKKNKIAAIDTSKTVKDSIIPHSARKAAIYSAILPGLGQAYNKKYWKIGIIVAGTGALIYSLNFSQGLYKNYKSELIKRQQNLGDLNPELNLYSDANLNELQSYYRRNRDLSIIGMFLLYALNIVDANVDGHLFDFDVSEDLSLKISPSPFNIYAGNTRGSGFSISLNF